MDSEERRPDEPKLSDSKLSVEPGAGALPAPEPCPRLEWLAPSAGNTMTYGVYHAYATNL